MGVDVKATFDENVHNINMSSLSRKKKSILERGALIFCNALFLQESENDSCMSVGTSSEEGRYPGIQRDVWVGSLADEKVNNINETSVRSNGERSFLVLVAVDVSSCVNEALHDVDAVLMSSLLDGRLVVTKGLVGISSTLEKSIDDLFVSSLDGANEGSVLLDVAFNVFSFAETFVHLLGSCGGV